ncbi:MAG: efflux RND transporter permease subunit [bacterium]|nr:efflux RND transporter permease subunit [Planctomycetota bacterium]HIL51868.1 efflux RND transporter permease subunit [Planctomycetota bacterium]
MIRFALRNPYLVVVGALTLFVLGFFSLQRIPADLLPVFRTPAVQIVTLYPGMPPEVVERDIMSRLQRWTGQSVGIAHQEAKAMLGVCIVKDFFREDIDDATAMSQVTSLAMSDMFYLPPGTLPPMVMPFDPTASVPLCLLAVSSETMSEKELYDVAYYEMRNRLQAIRGVVAPAVYGGVLRRILAYVDRDKLEARNLSPLSVVQALEASNPFVPTGSAKMGDLDYLVLSNAMVERVEELADIPISREDGTPIFLSDIGEPRDSHQIQSNIVRINGRRQVYIPIYRQPGANTLDIVDEVKAKSARILERIREFDPKAADLRMDVVMDQSKVVRGTLNSLSISGAIGAFLVALVVLLFLGSMRHTLIVLVALPLACMGAFIGLFFTGDSLNSMTLGGLSLAIGILVDQSIVVTENITRHMGLGKTRLRAALDGTQEVALPVFVSTLTFVVVFFPVVFLSGMARFLFTPLALAVTFATVTSLFVALTVIPALSARFMPTEVRPEGPIFRRVSEAYRSLVRVCFKAKFLVAGSALLAAGGAVWGLGQLGTELFPRVDAGQFTILMRAPVGTRLEKTEELVAEVEQLVQKIVGEADPGDLVAGSDLALLISNIGVLYDWPAAYTPNTGPMDAFVQCQLKDEREQTSQEWASILRKRLTAEFPDVQFSIDTGGMLTAALNQGLPAPIDIQIQGSDLAISHEIAEAIVSEVREIPGAVDVRVDQPLEYPAVMIDVDRIKAAEVGLTQEEVIKNVVTAINSSVNFNPSFWIDPNNGNHYLIGAQYPEDDIQDFNTLLEIPIVGAATSQPVLLGNVAQLSRTTSPAVVRHINITRTVDVYANVEGRDLGGLAEAIEERLATSPSFQKLMDKYGGRGYRYAVRGEVQSMNESFEQFGTGLVVAALLVFLVLVAQLRSFLLPIVIFLAVPMGLIGVVSLLWITGTHLSIPSFMGLILMVGLVVEYSILLVDYAARRQRAGVDLESAVLEAARHRLRPLLMASLTTVLALLPMAIGFGVGGEGNLPLARAIIGAVLGGTFLTLFVVPALYGILGRYIQTEESHELDGAH